MQKPHRKFLVEYYAHQDLAWQVSKSIRTWWRRPSADLVIFFLLSSYRNFRGSYIMGFALGSNWKSSWIKCYMETHFIFKVEDEMSNNSITQCNHHSMSLFWKDEFRIARWARIFKNFMWQYLTLSWVIEITLFNMNSLRIMLDFSECLFYLLKSSKEYIFLVIIKTTKNIFIPKIFLFLTLL